ncbi:cation-translocating P-type ATPase [Malacoplasma muris]|uniref:cation-translocating P-type ATPase n=1 Tax=Malacoplasma muris TaxID=2119 RepID=UPI00398E8D0A
MNTNAIEAQSNLKTNFENGLSSGEVETRLKQYGYNRLAIKKRKNFFLKYLEQFKDPMLILLLIAAIVSYVISGVPAFHTDVLTNVEKVIEWVEPSIIILIVLINTIFGAVQEVKAEKAMDSLEKMTTPIAKVLRNGDFDQVSSYELVPGDIVILEAGDTIPIDGIIVESSSFKVIESVLTGESLPIEKNDEFSFDESTPIGDRLNMVYSGTNVVNGRATVIVTKTGMSTEIGKIASLLNNTKDEWSPLEKRMAKVGKILSIFASICLILVFLLYIFYVNDIGNIQNTWSNGFKISVSIAIAVVPEGLLAILTIVLALGVKRMINYNALIKKTSSVETLGSASVICSDKTGTLTQNKMTIVEVFANNKSFTKLDDKNVLKIIEYGMLCNDTKIDENVLIGDPTETAIVKAGQNFNIDYEKLRDKYIRVEELPFDSDRKLMTTINKISSKEYLIITKGAPDNLFKICKNKTDKFLIANDEMSKKALRVLAIAIKKVKAIPKNINSKTIEKDLELIGLFGIIDPPREEVKDAIQTCLEAGIRPIMITGDHVNTASAIATELGILQEGQLTISGQELSMMTDEQLKNNVKNYSVYARVSPEDKIRVVEAWQANDQIVAMTGDGVNDAPALKAANIGCAMGITGTEVSKDAADMILMDDNFNTIVQAVREGRGILDNIKRIMITLFTTNLTELLTLVFGMLIFAFNPFTAIQILWVNLVTESFPGIALGMKKPEKQIMRFDPKSSKNLLNGKMLFRIFAQGMIFAALSLLAFFLGASSVVGFDYKSMYTVLKQYENVNAAGREILFAMQMRGSIMAFIVLSVSQSFNAFNTFSSKNIFTYKWSDIKYVFIAFCVSFSAILFVTMIPSVNEVFNSNIYTFGNSMNNISYWAPDFKGEIINDSISINQLLKNQINQEIYLQFNNQWYFPLIAIVFAFIPTIIFEIAKLVNNSEKFIQFSKSNKFLNAII